MGNEKIIKGLKKTILKYRELAGCKYDKKFIDALEKVNDKDKLMSLVTQWKTIVISKYNGQLIDILLENCQ